MKKILLLALLLVNSIVYGQSKINFDLARRIKESPNSSQLINVFIKGDVETVKQLCLVNQGTFRYSSGNISTISIPVSSVKAFINNPLILRIEAYTPHNQPLSDTMLIQTNTVQVHSGAAPLPQGYDGSGIVIGIIDTGIDFTHPDFQDSLGKSRIDFLWDQSLPSASNTPMPYNYGQEWNNLQIDSGLAVSHNDLNYLGHGTHVAGIAVGNGLATGTYKGVAPEADIIVVAMDFNSSSSTLISDATDYIYAKAQAMGKPCVINASLGDYYGSHDGQDLQAQLISNMIDSQTGRAFVAAAGNAGDIAYHLENTVTSDTNFTFINYGSQPAYIQLWADTADFKDVEFAIGVDQISPYSFRGNIPFSDISSHLGIVLSDTLYNNGNRIGRVLSYGDIINGTYSMEFLIYPDSTSYKWRLMTTGNGHFDAWSFDLHNGPIPSAAEMADSIHYKFPDKNKTTVSSFQCLDNVVAVANYTNRKTYIDYNNAICVNTASNPGVRHITSSAGPTRDGRIKPDIASPGDNTIAAVVLSIAPDIIANYPDALALGGYHVRNGGTSHSSPSVAGIAALYLQKNPTATAMDVKNAIIDCPIRDSYTGTALPDNYWGYGKVDAFGALTCSLTGINEKKNDPGFKIYPNPNNSGCDISIDISGFNLNSKNELTIYNSLGQLIKTIRITNNQTRINTFLLPGIYFCNLTINGIQVSAEKLVIL
jgi:subtilisin family serine protease